MINLLHTMPKYKCQLIIGEIFHIAVRYLNRRLGVTLTPLGKLLYLDAKNIIPNIKRVCNSNVEDYYYELSEETINNQAFSKIKNIMENSIDIYRANSTNCSEKHVTELEKHLENIIDIHSTNQKGV